MNVEIIAADPTRQQLHRRAIVAVVAACAFMVVVAVPTDLTGAMSWFAPVQPLLVVAGIAMPGRALWSRVADQRSCPPAAHRGAN